MPQVVSLGALTWSISGPRGTVPAQFEGRLFYEHNASVTLMRTTASESEELGRRVGQKLASATSPTIVVIPRGGVSAWTLRASRSGTKRLTPCFLRR